MSDYGHQCDAITVNGIRCRKLNRWFTPCRAVYDARFGSYRAVEYLPVRLCQWHWVKEIKLRKQGNRLQLHGGGWLGPYNRHGYGSLVIDSPTVDWGNPKLSVPEAWKLTLTPHETS